MARDYKLPKELMEIPEIAEKFETPQQIGTFIKFFPKKLEFYPTRRSTLIDRILLVKFLRHIDRFPDK